MMQRDQNFKIGIGGSILETDKGLIVMGKYSLWGI